MKHMKQLSVFLIISLLFLVTACGSANNNAAESTTLTGNPENGLVLFKQYCSECHDIAEGQVIEGPPLFEAGTRLDYDYVKESILYPTEHIAYYEGIYDEDGTNMPTDFKKLLSDRQLDDVIAYLMSLE